MRGTRTLLGLLALEVAVQCPDLSGAQSLEPNAHTRRLLGASRLDPTDFASHLDRFGLRGDAETDQEARLQRKGLRRLDEHATQRYVAGRSNIGLVVHDELNIQPACVAGICATELI